MPKSSDGPGRMYPSKNGRGIVAQVETGENPFTGKKRSVDTETFPHYPTGKDGSVTQKDKRATEARARAWRVEIAAQVANGTYWQSKPTIEPPPTLREYAKLRFDTQRKASGRRHLSQNSRDHYDYVMGRVLKPFLDMPLDKITADAVSAHYLALHDQGVGGGVIELANKAARSVFAAAMDRITTCDLPRNPFRQVVEDLPKARTAVRNVLDEEGVRKFLNFHDRQPADPATGEPGRAAHPLLPLLRLQLDLGIRRSELLGIRWCDVDIENQTVWIHWTTTINPATGEVKFEERTKTAGSTRIQHISPEGVARLVKLREQQRERAELLGVPFRDQPQEGVKPEDLARVCVDPEKLVPIHPTRWSRIVTAASKAAGGPPFSSHGFRRTNGSAINARMGITTASRSLGHTHISMTEGYVKTFDPDLKAAASVIDSIMAGSDVGA